MQQDKPTNLSNVDATEINFIAKAFGIDTQVLKLSQESGDVYVIPDNSGETNTVKVIPEEEMQDFQQYIE